MKAVSTKNVQVHVEGLIYVLNKQNHFIYQCSLRTAQLKQCGVMSDLKVTVTFKNKKTITST